MISSPCKNCSMKNLPKDNCVQDCKLLHAIQEAGLSAEKLYDGSGIDYTEEYSYYMPVSPTTSSF